MLHVGMCLFLGKMQAQRKMRAAPVPCTAALVLKAAGLLFLVQVELELKKKQSLLAGISIVSPAWPLLGSCCLFPYLPLDTAAHCLHCITLFCHAASGPIQQSCGT
jgi:hypothetical protein